MKCSDGDESFGLRKGTSTVIKASSHGFLHCSKTASKGQLQFNGLVPSCRDAIFGCPGLDDKSCRIIHGEEATSSGSSGQDPVVDDGVSLTRFLEFEASIEEHFNLLHLKLDELQRITGTAPEAKADDAIGDGAVVGVRAPRRNGAYRFPLRQSSTAALLPSRPGSPSGLASASCLDLRTSIGAQAQLRLDEAAPEERPTVLSGMSQKPATQAKRIDLSHKLAKSKTTVHLGMTQSDLSQKLATQVMGRERSTTAGVQICEHDTLLRRLVTSQYFDFFINGCVLTSVVLLGVQVEFHESDVVVACANSADMLMGLIFSVELLMRLATFWGDFFRGRDGFSNLFDMVLVLLSWIDALLFILDASTVTFNARVAKVARLARMLRMARLIRRITKLRIMLTMICGSMWCLFYLFLLLSGMMYVFSVVLAQGAIDWLQTAEAIGDEEMRKNVKHHFGGVLTAMFYLYEAITGGKNWGELADFAFLIGPFYGASFAAFIFFVTFSVLNIVTGVFVDGAIQLGDRDRDARSAKRREAEASLAEDLSEFLHTIDVDGSGIISASEWNQTIRTRECTTMLNALGINMVGAGHLFDILDANGDGMIDIDELVSGIQRFRGPATAIHMHGVMERLNYLMFNYKIKRTDESSPAAVVQLGNVE